jgi:hypothetical protein
MPEVMPLTRPELVAGLPVDAEKFRRGARCEKLNRVFGIRIARIPKAKSGGCRLLSAPRDPERVKFEGDRDAEP